MRGPEATPETTEVDQAPETFHVVSVDVDRKRLEGAAVLAALGRTTVADLLHGVLDDLPSVAVNIHLADPLPIRISISEDTLRRAWSIAKPFRKNASDLFSLAVDAALCLRVAEALEVDREAFSLVAGHHAEVRAVGLALPGDRIDYESWREPVARYNAVWADLGGAVALTLGVRIPPKAVEPKFDISGEVERQQRAAAAAAAERAKREAERKKLEAILA